MTQNDTNKQTKSKQKEYIYIGFFVNRAPVLYNLLPCQQKRHCQQT